MRPIDFINKFTSLCKQYSQRPESVFQHLPQEELQWLADAEDAEEWICLEYLLSLYRDDSTKQYLQSHQTKLPQTDCFSCCHYQSDNDWCDKHKKVIPKHYDKHKACKAWNT